MDLPINHEDAPWHSDTEIVMKPVGVIHSAFVAKANTPIQGVFNAQGEATIEIFSEYLAGLKDLTLFSHLYLLYYFDRGGAIQLTRVPFLDDKPHGIFATRHPARPNRIGITVVSLLACHHNTLTVAGADMLHHTPLLDIKPYVPRFDAFPQAHGGWLQGKENRSKPPDRE